MGFRCSVLLRFSVVLNRGTSEGTEDAEHPLCHRQHGPCVDWLPLAQTLSRPPLKAGCGEEISVIADQ